MKPFARLEKDLEEREKFVEDNLSDIKKEYNEYVSKNEGKRILSFEVLYSNELKRPGIKPRRNH